MKTILCLIAIVIFAGCAKPPPIVPDPVAESLLDKVVVASSDLNLDAPQEYDGALLWKVQLIKPLDRKIDGKLFDRKFDEISSEHWFSNWQKYKARLIANARQGGFDTVSLERCLNKIEPSPKDKIALLPVGAYTAKKGTTPVWIIVCMWKYATYTHNGVLNYSTLGHVQIWALKAKNAKKVGFATCG